MNTICLSSVVTIPNILFLVVFGRHETMATFSPVKELISVDLPAFGSPTIQTKPVFIYYPLFQGQCYLK